MARSSVRSHRPRRCRRGARSPRCRCVDGRGSGGRSWFSRRLCEVEAAVAVTGDSGLLLQGARACTAENRYGRNDHRPGNLTRAQRRAIRRPPPGRAGRYFPASSRQSKSAVILPTGPSGAFATMLRTVPAGSDIAARRSPCPPNVHVSRHPAVLHARVLRDEKTEPKKFREVVPRAVVAARLRGLQDVRITPITVDPARDRGR